MLTICEAIKKSLLLGLTEIGCKSIPGPYFANKSLQFVMELEGKDKTERFIIAAKDRAKAAIDDPSPKLTSLEKAMWQAMKNHRGHNRSNHHDNKAA